MGNTTMNSQEIQEVQLKEIKDYRGNLSFAEENNPIPFDIKSVFWTTLTKDISLSIDAQSFIIILDGKLKLNDAILDQPNQAYLAPKDSKLNLSLLSQEAVILIVMDTAIDAIDESKSSNKLLEMPYIKDFNGLKGYFANSNSTLPFDIRRVYFTYNIPETAKRGGHAHIYTKEIVFPIKGQFDVIMENKETCATVHLNKYNEGIFLNTGIWRELENFKDKSLVLVLASDSYYEADYIREYADFKKQYK